MLQLLLTFSLQLKVSFLTRANEREAGVIMDILQKYEY